MLIDGLKLNISTSIISHYKVFSILCQRSKFDQAKRKPQIFAISLSDYIVAVFIVYPTQRILENFLN